MARIVLTVDHVEAFARQWPGFGEPAELQFEFAANGDLVDVWGDEGTDLDPSGLLALSHDAKTLCGLGEGVEADLAWLAPSLPYPAIWGLMGRYRPYKCNHCGHGVSLSTNHTGGCNAYCPGCSWTPSKYPVAMYYGGRAYRAMSYAGRGEDVGDVNPHAVTTR